MARWRSQRQASHCHIAGDRTRRVWRSKRAGSIAKVPIGTLASCFSAALWANHLKLRMATHRIRVFQSPLTLPRRQRLAQFALQALLVQRAELAGHFDAHLAAAQPERLALAAAAAAL